MKMNLKQQELSHWLYERLKEKFPEIQFAGIEESPDDPGALWVKITGPEDEDREIELIEMSSNISADILSDYGYHITTVSASPDEVKEIS